MRRLSGMILAVLLLWSTAAHAENLGCFNASGSVHIWAQFANASGVAASPTSPSAKVFSPTDTTAASFTPTLAEIDSSGSPGLARGSFTLGASPTAGIWTVQYKGTVSGNVLVSTDVFQVPCPSMGIRAGAITPGAYATDGTISTISTVTLTLSADVISATNQFAYQARIEVYNPSTFLLKATSCITASTTAAGPADTVVTAEDISALIATSDAFTLIPDPACRGLRAATAGRNLNVASSGQAGTDFSDINGTLDAAEIGAGAITNAKFAAGAIDATAIATDAITAAKIAAGAITSSEAPNLDAAVSGRASQTSLDAKIPTNLSFTGANVNANAQVVADKTGYALTSADKLAILTAASGTADSGSTTTIVDAERTESGTDYWKDSCVLMTSGNAVNQLRRISAFNATSDTITLASAFTAAIATGDTYVLLRTAQCIDAGTVSGNVTVGGYAAGQNPADHILVTPANKIATNASNQVVASSVQGNVTGSVGSVTSGVTVTTNNDKAGYSLNFGQALPASPTTDTVGESLKFASSRLDGAITSRAAATDYTTARAAKLDNLDVVLSTRSSQSSLDAKIPTNFTFTGSFVRAQIAGMDADVVTAAAIAPGAIGASETGLPTGAVATAVAGCNGGSNSTTVFATNLGQTATNFWSNTQLVTFTSGVLAGQTKQISGYAFANGTNGCITVASGFTAVPSVGDTFLIVNK